MKIIYNNEEPPVGVVQIIHGMSEYCNRYFEFSEFLNKNNYIAILSDHRGHGEEALKKNQLGNFSDSFDVLVFDQIKITKKIRELYPELPFFVLGHSMGSFIAEKHMKICSNIVSGYIFMGSCSNRPLLFFFGKSIFKYIILFSNNSRNILNKLLFLGFNVKVKDTTKNRSSWLSRDPEVVKSFSNDPHCGFTYTPKFYYNFINFLSHLYKIDTFKFIRKDISILITSGEADPVGLYGFGVKKLYDFYKKLNFNNVTLKIYKDARHELLNEINKKEVFNDILSWLNKKE